MHVAALWNIHYPAQGCGEDPTWHGATYGDKQPHTSSEKLWCGKTRNAIVRTQSWDQNPSIVGAKCCVTWTYVDRNHWYTVLYFWKQYNVLKALKQLFYSIKKQKICNICSCWSAAVLIWTGLLRLIAATATNGAFWLTNSPFSVR